MSKPGSTLFIFNPEHDFALAVGSGPYTPPGEIIKIRKKFALLPAIPAGDSDFIIIPDDVSTAELHAFPYHDLVLRKNIRTLTLGELSEFIPYISSIQPWGWDHAIRRTLSEAGVPDDLLLSDHQLDDIRSLSHRREVIRFREMMAKETGEEIFNLPQEIFSVKEVEVFLEKHPKSYFKAPWSSSGRGIVVSDHISRKGLMEWSHGIIRRQGSLMAEPAWERVFDFASEWIISEGEPKFLGYSVFETSSRGKYHGNMYESQTRLLEIIKEKVPGFSESIIEAQKLAIQKLIAPKYSGYLGIDMFADKAGRINPCVELNLRLTMGHLYL